METRSSSETKHPGLLKAILLAGLLVGTLDITAASIQTLVNGREPLNMLKFIASGVFGKTALSGGMSYALYGLFFHYCIALGWSSLFFMMYPRFSFLWRRTILTGFGYGIFVWFMMSRIVLPLSNVPRLPFRFGGAMIGASILIVAIGIPLSLMANKFYKTNGNG